MKEPEFRLETGHREVVDAILVRHCTLRGWVLHARNVRSNHVHAVITSPGCPPDRAIEQFKAWSTRALKEVLPGRQRFWTEGGSRRYINTSEQLEMAIRYVLEGQDW
ncbi:MAG: transposase [Isosphaeraceae bacterium]